MAVRMRKARKRLSPEQRREEILDAAQRVFVTHDPSAVTFEEIAAEAGVSRALVYNYFGDRGSLLAEVYRQALGDLDGALVAALATDGDADRRLRAMVACYVRFATNHTGTWQLVGHLAAVQHPAVREVHRERVHALAAALGDTPSIRLGVAGLLGLLEGVTRHWLDQPEGPPEELLVELERQAWSGFSALFAGCLGGLAD